VLAEQLSGNPTASIPLACGGWAGTAAAYRFFAQDKLEWTDVMEPHWQGSAERMRACDMVLCLDDTTGLNFNGQDIAGLGPFSYEAQRGMYVHATYAVTPQREPLGMLNAWMWAPEPRAPMVRVAARRKARAGLKDTNAWPSRRRICPVPGWCMSRGPGVGHPCADAPGARSGLSGALADSRPAQSRVTRGSKALESRDAS
jgi:hypothetical protein